MATAPAFFTRSWLAAAIVLAAALALIGVTRIEPIAGSDGATLLILVNAALVLIALPGTVLPGWSTIGRLILWSASGWCLMLLLGGIFSFGYLMVLPLAAIVLGLVAWPRTGDDMAMVSGPALIAQVGGFAALFIALVFAMLVR